MGPTNLVIAESELPLAPDLGFVTPPPLWIVAVAGIGIGVALAVAAARRHSSSRLAPTSTAGPTSHPGVRVDRVAHATMWLVIAAWSALLIARAIVGVAGVSHVGMSDDPDTAAALLWLAQDRLARATGVVPAAITIGGMITALFVSWRGAPRSAGSAPNSGPTPSPVATVRRTWRSFVSTASLVQLGATTALAVLLAVACAQIASANTAAIAQAQAFMQQRADAGASMTWSEFSPVADTVTPTSVLVVIVAAMAAITLHRIAQQRTTDADEATQRRARWSGSAAIVTLATAAGLLALGSALHFFGSPLGGWNRVAIVEPTSSHLLWGDSGTELLFDASGAYRNIAPLLAWLGAALIAWSVALIVHALATPLARSARSWRTHRRPSPHSTARQAVSPVTILAQRGARGHTSARGLHREASIS